MNEVMFSDFDAMMSAPLEFPGFHCLLVFCSFLWFCGSVGTLEGFRSVGRLKKKKSDHCVFVLRTLNAA